MNKQEKVRQIQHAMNTALCGLEDDPFLARRAIAQAKAKAKPKKKVSVKLVLLFVLLLAGIAATATTLLWQDYVPQMKQAEQELGDYAQWPAARRIQLAKDLAAMGYLPESEDTLLLASETAAAQEKADAADRLMCKLTGQDDVREVHSSLITYAVLGHEDTWAPEQRAWWNSILQQNTDAQSPDTLLAPCAEAVSEQDAIAIARAAIQAAYGFDDRFMDSMRPVADFYVTAQRPDYKRWNVQFKQYREGSDTYLEKVYSAVVDENGEVIADPDTGIAHPAESAARTRTSAAGAAKGLPPSVTAVYEQYGRLAGGKSIWALSLQEKADWLGGDNGVPGEEDLSETEAVQIACDRLASIGYDMASYQKSVWYKTGDPLAQGVSRGGPVYIVFFLDDSDNPTSAFSVTIDAITGKVDGTDTPMPLSANP